MNIENITPGMRVAYVPRHHEKSSNHPDSEHGTVAYTNLGYVFVRFDEQVKHLGGAALAQACNPENLIKLP